MPTNATKEQIATYFDVMWKVYPKKEGKQQAIKTFEHKLRGMSDDEAKLKSREIYTTLVNAIKMWSEQEREYRYIPMFSSWLNNEIEDSKHFKGGRRL